MTFKPYLKAFEERIENALPLPEGPQKIVYEAARYSLLSGGKRIRPLLTLLTAEAFGGSLEKAMIPALAIEMVHTYSLIHDDLPGMDNDDFRRGKPTLHKVYPEGQAILAGDLLLTEAFSLLSRTSEFRDEEKIAMISALAYASGGEGMIGGQAIDLLKIHSDLERLHLMKTGALFAAAVELGALSCQVPREARKTLKKFASSLGLAFQIIDDVLDKETFAPEKSAAEVALNLAIKELESLNCDFNYLKKLAYTLVDRDI